MSASVVEQILARVETVLAALPVFVGVSRSSVFSISEADLPYARIRRGATESAIYSERLRRARVEFEIELYAAGADYETATDTLHVAVDTALLQDAPLAALGRGLCCVSTEIAPEAAEITVGKLTARYEIHVVTRPGDLTRAIS